MGGFGAASRIRGGEGTSMKALRWSAGSAAVVAALLVAACSGGSSGTATTGSSSPASVVASGRGCAGPGGEVRDVEGGELSHLVRADAGRVQGVDEHEPDAVRRDVRD